MLRYPDPKITPPGSVFPYKDPDTGFEIKELDLKTLQRSVKAHRIANSLPIGTNINAQIEDNSCRLVLAKHPNWQGTVDHNDLPPFRKANTVTFDQLLTFFKFLATVIAKGAQPVAREVAEERAKICVTCPLNVKVEGCLPCALKGLFRSVKGDRTTSLDGQLNACDACGCDLKTKIWWRKDAIYREGQVFPDHCWVNKE